MSLTIGSGSTTTTVLSSDSTSSGNDDVAAIKEKLASAQKAASDAEAAGFGKHPLVKLGVPAIAEGVTKICQFKRNGGISNRRLFLASRQGKQSDEHENGEAGHLAGR